MCDPNKDCTCILDMQTAHRKMDAADILCQPHVYMRPDLRKDGNLWSAFYGPNTQEGVCGFGKTPEKAMQDFDKNWRTEKIMNPAQSGGANE